MDSIFDSNITVPGAALISRLIWSCIVFQQRVLAFAPSVCQQYTTVETVNLEPCGISTALYLNCGASRAAVPAYPMRSSIARRPVREPGFPVMSVCMILAVYVRDESAARSVP